MFFVYILVSCLDGSLYIGQTSEMKKRLREHNGGRVKVTRSRAPFALGYFEEFGTRREAMWREWELKKKFNTDRKKQMIAAFDRRKAEMLLGL